MIDRLHVLITTPREVVLDTRVAAMRLPTQTGQVGLRPRQEPILLVVEPGLVVLRSETSLRFAATAGGLLEGDRERAVLYTPFAAVGDEEASLMEALDRVLSTPDGELAARRRLGELEGRIVEELRQRPSGARARGRHG